MIKGVLFDIDGTLFDSVSTHLISYGVATISRLLKIIGLFCRISSLCNGSFAKEICNFKEPTNRSHPIHLFWHKNQGRSLRYRRVISQSEKSRILFESVVFHVGMSHVTRMNESCRRRKDQGRTLRYRRVISQTLQGYSSYESFCT